MTINTPMTFALNNYYDNVGKVRNTGFEFTTTWNDHIGKFGYTVGGNITFNRNRILSMGGSVELAYCQEAVANWKRLKPAILDGDLFRLVSPYDGNHMAVAEVSKDKGKAVLFAYDLHPRFKEKVVPVKLQGLDAARRYRVEEINLMPGVKSSMKEHGKTYTGDFLMKVGLNVLTSGEMESKVVELTAE